MRFRHKRFQTFAEGLFIRASIACKLFIFKVNYLTWKANALESPADMLWSLADRG
jgi:hypothetical protein